MMALGAAIAFICVFETGSHLLGFAVGAAVGVVFAMVFAGLVLAIRANEMATGLATSVTGLGLSVLFGKSCESLTISGPPKLGLPLLSEIPVLGQTLFKHDIAFWLVVLGTVLLWYLLTRTKLG